MDDDSVFDRAPVDWSDVEIRVGLAVCAEELTELPPGGPGYELAHMVASALAVERDRRAVLYREAAGAVNPFRVVAPGRVLASPSERRRRGRGRSPGGDC